MKFNDKIPTHSIVRVPCPHCSHLCSAKTKNCPKCGEPLKPLENTASKEENATLIEERSNEILYIKLLEKKIGKSIPQLDKLKRGKRSFKMNSNQIVGLSLYNCNLLDIPPEIMNLKSLKSLYLRRNKIEKIPNSIGFMNNLEDLILSINEIEVFPKSLGLLRNLKTLYLDSNKLYELPDIFNTLNKLEILLLTNNRLRELPQSLKTLSNLKNLDVRGNLLLNMPEMPQKPKKTLKKKAKQVSLDKYLRE